MKCVYGDESSDEKRERVFSAGGLFGSEEDWREAQAAWLNITGGAEVHATECESRHPELFLTLIRVLANSKLSGWAAVMSLEDYDLIFENPVKNLPYYDCFSKVLAHFAYFTKIVLPQEKVKLTFDQNLQTQFNAANLYEYMLNLPEWEDGRWLHDELAFSNRKNPKIQAADFWVRETMKQADSSSFQILRPGMQILHSRKRFGMKFFKKSYFEEMRRDILMRHEPGHSMPEYDAWRAKKKMQDTMENRIRYHIYLNLKAAGGQSENKQRIQGVRQNDASDSERSAHRDQGEAGSGEGSKKAEES